MTRKCICHVCGRKFDADVDLPGGIMYGGRLLVSCNIIDPKAHTPNERLRSWQKFLEENHPYLKRI
ncbi:MAG: hypothetical protein QME45_02425 [Clostridiales bacterium]|nr:hypothetical protein [Clostridiales bacterium]